MIFIKSVNGSAMKVYGSAVLPLKIGALSVSHEFILADIVPDVLLGIDFLRQHSCIVDYSNNAFVVGDNCTPMSDAAPYVLSSEVSHSEPYVSCHVALCQAITVPGYSQVISPARVDLPETNSSQSSPAGIVEPVESFLEKYYIGAAQFFSKVSPDRTVPVRFQNFLPDPVTIQAKTVVAKFSTIFLCK